MGLKPKLIREETFVEKATYPAMTRTERDWQWDDGSITKSAHYSHLETPQVDFDGAGGAFNGNWRAFIPLLVVLGVLAFAGVWGGVSLLFSLIAAVL